MSPLAVFFRTLSRASAIFLGVATIALHPSLEWHSAQRADVAAQQAPQQAAVDALSTALADPDATVRQAAAFSLARLRSHLERCAPPVHRAEPSAHGHARKTQRRDAR